MAPLLSNALGILIAMQAAVAPRAAVTGAVRDQETGEPLAGAVVQLTDLQRTTSTDRNGRYVLRDVPPGPQRLTARSISHLPQIVYALVPPNGELELNLSLRPDPFRLPTIEVRPPVTLRGVEPGDSAAFPDRASSLAAVRNDPLLPEPDAFGALEGGEVVLHPESPSGMHIRGGASDQTAYLIDGIPIFSPYHAAGVFSAWNPDALAELRLSSAAPSPAYPGGLSGTVTGVTREPGAQPRAQGSVSTTQARLTADGPLGVGGASYLFSQRSAFPGSIAPKREATYLRSEAGDWLAKFGVPVLGGTARLLGYDSDNEIGAAATAGETGPALEAPRNVFAWHSRSLGAGWTRASSSGTIHILGWSAAGDAGADWTAPPGRVRLSTARRDLGVLAELEHHSAGATTLAGIRVERSATSYQIASDSAGRPPLKLSARTPVATAFLRHARAIGPHVRLELGTSLAATGGDHYLGPGAQLRWKMAQRLTLSGSYVVTYQFAQSLRNAESVVGTVFPADLYVGAGARGIPVARSDQVVLAADYRPSAGVRIGVQGYRRRLDGLVLVAPRAGDPFSTAAFALGRGAATGVSLDATMSTAHAGIVARYALQRVRLAYGDSSYVPGYGAAHLFEGGVIVFPTATFSVRVAATGELGRRATVLSGGLEWEACNLLDRGCEFGGSPHYDGEPLGGTTLPAYFRVDLGARKQWQVRIGGRDASIGLFGTITNLFNRKNVLTYARNPSTGGVAPIEMRPQAPLVVGLDWRF